MQAHEKLPEVGTKLSSAAAQGESFRIGTSWDHPRIAWRLGHVQFPFLLNILVFGSRIAKTSQLWHDSLTHGKQTWREMAMKNFENLHDFLIINLCEPEKHLSPRVIYCDIHVHSHQQVLLPHTKPVKKPKTCISKWTCRGQWVYKQTLCVQIDSLFIQGISMPNLPQRKMVSNQNATAKLIWYR
jgi:hypothetical protein